MRSEHLRRVRWLLREREKLVCVDFLILLVQLLPAYFILKLSFVCVDLDQSELVMKHNVAHLSYPFIDIFYLNIIKY